MNNIDMMNYLMAGRAPPRAGLFDRNAFCQVPRLVNVAAAQHRTMIRKKLQGHDGEDRHQKFVVLGNLDDVIHQGAELCIADGGNGDNAAFAGANLLDVGDDLLVGAIFRGIAMVGKAGSMSAMGPCFISPAA